MESTGQAKAEAQARAEAAKIEASAAVQEAELKAKAVEIESEAELKRLTAARDAEIRIVSIKLMLPTKIMFSFISCQNLIFRPWNKIYDEAKRS